MKKVLVATEKPFAPVAIKGIREVTDAAGYELVLLEKYTSKQELLAAVADVDAIIIRSDIVDAEVMEAAKNLKIVKRNFKKIRTIFAIFSEIFTKYVEIVKK